MKIYSLNSLETGIKIKFMTDDAQNKGVSSQLAELVRTYTHYMLRTKREYLETNPRKDN